MEVIGEDGEVYEVEGYDGEDYVEGDVMGDVMGGYAGPMGNFEGSAVVGYDYQGEPIILDGAGRRVRRRRPVRRGRSPVLVRKPGWRKSTLAPGVIAPDQGLLTLPMGNFTFSATAGGLNTFEGQVQKPFRGERLLVSVTRTGTSAVGRLLSQLFVGTDLQQLDVTQFDAEVIGAPTAFGVRLTMKPAQPGVFIRLITALNVVPTTTDTIFASVQLLGRNVH